MSGSRKLFRNKFHVVGPATAKVRRSVDQQSLQRRKQASKFIRQNNIMTILIQDVNNTMAGYQKEILPSSWSPIVKLYCVYSIDSEAKEALGANIKPGKNNIKRNEKLTTETHQYCVMECENTN